MNLKIYQAYYKEEQIPFLEKGFTPFDNTINEHPELREYPLMKKLHSMNKNKNIHWGLVSWKWKNKTNISGEKFISWIKSNPEYDVYLINPFIENVLYNNPFLQAEMHHKGITEFTNKLLSKVGYDTKVQYMIFPLNTIFSCNFFIANKKFWNDWIYFCDACIQIVKDDPELYKFMFLDKTDHGEHGGGKNIQIINFSFIVERLSSLYMAMYHKKYKIKHYPYSERIENMKESDDRKLINYDFAEYVKILKEIIFRKGAELYKEHI